ncbi:hypothetical protein C8Q70DRAFT_970062 [Cubamyces menziesii]|nr:hypothetical protein C8Q70DRAFT_970062 [Cubamyces menziesii]
MGFPVLRPADTAAFKHIGNLDQERLSLGHRNPCHKSVTKTITERSSLLLLLFIGHTSPPCENLQMYCCIIPAHMSSYLPTVVIY